MITCTFEDGNAAALRHVVTDTLVLKDNKVLLVKRSPGLLDGGKWGVVGGIMERDETLTECAVREVMEETGWQVKDLTLLTVVDKPDRLNEDRQNVAFVYFCQATKKTGQPDDESTEQQWFSFDALPTPDQMAFDHANHIELYKKYLINNFRLPVTGTH